MKTIKLGDKVELQCPTIVKIQDDYYLVSKKYYPKSFTNKGKKKHIAINMNDGKWFDWGDDIPCLHLDEEIFEKGTKFEIEI